MTTQTIIIKRPGEIIETDLDTLIANTETALAKAKAMRANVKKETNMTEDEHEETVAKFARAIEMQYQCNPVDARTSAINMMADEKVMAKMLPRIAPYLHSAAASVDKAEAVRKGLPVEKRGFDKCIADIRKRDNCSRQEAMSRARQEYPAEFEHYQNT